MRTLSGGALVLGLLLLPSPPAAAARLVVVMPLDLSHAKGKVDADARASLEEAIRDAAANVLGAQGWTVLSAEATQQGLKSVGVEAKDCGAESCQRRVATALNAGRFVRSMLHFVDSEFTGVVQLIALDGGIVGSVALEGPTVTALRRDFAARSAQLFRAQPPSRVAEASPPAVPSTPGMTVDPGRPDPSASGTPTPLQSGAPTGREPSNPGANMPRTLWVNRLMDAVPAAVCDTRYFKQCFSASRDDCVAAARRIEGKCFDRQLPYLPDYLDAVSGNDWGGKIGKCTGPALEEALVAQKSTDPKCSDASLWQ